MPLAASDDGPATEESPLLRSDAGEAAGSSTVESGPKPADDGEHHDASTGSPILSEPSTLKLIGVMSSAWFGTFLAALDSTMVATLTGPISSSFNSLTLISWLASAYFVANAALQPLSGKLTDIYGRRAGLIFSNVFFCAGNLICGLAKEEWVIIFGRIIAGIGGGGLPAISTFVASDLVPLRRRGLWQGIGNIMYGIGAACGGVFGGFVNDRIGWRWAFLIQVPFTVLSTIVVFFTIKIPVRDEDGRSRLRRVDFLGALSLVFFLVLLLLGLNSGGNTVAWTHPLVLTTIPASLLLLGVFIYIEANVATEPILPVRILSYRTVIAAYFTNWFHSMALFSVLYYAPIYFQLRGASPTEAGLRIMPQSLGIMVGSVSTGAAMRWLGHYYRPNVAIQAVVVAGYAALLGYNLHTPRWPELVSFFLVGTGYSGMLTVTLIALIAAIDHKWQAVATSGSYAFRSTGSVIGITVSSAVFTNALKQELWSRLGEMDGAEPIIRKVRDSLDAVRYLPVEWKVPVMQAYMAALKAVFGTVLGMGFAGALISLFMREHKLYSDLARRNSG
jgi:MFS family permease